LLEFIGRKVLQALVSAVNLYCGKYLIEYTFSRYVWPSRHTQQTCTI